MFVLCSFAVSAGAAVDSPKDPLAVFREAAALLRASSALSVHVEKRFDVLTVDGAKVQYSGALDLVVRRSGGLHIDYGDDMSAKEAWYDGAKLTVFDHLEKVYASIPVQGSVEDVLTDVNRRYGLELPLATLLERKLAEDFESATERSRYLGIHDAEGVPCHHLLFRGLEKDLQIWVHAGEQPLLHKLVVTFRQIDGAPQQELVFSEWDLQAEVDPSVFKAKIPEGAIETEFLPRGKDQ